MANVGVATVSRVINESALISPQTRQLVQAVIRRLEYRPHAMARRILGRSQMLCFVLANRPFLHSFHAGILQGAESCARELKEQVVFVRIQCEEQTPPDQIQLPPMLEEKGWAEGVILTGAVFANLISRLEALDLPMAVFGNNVYGKKMPGGFNQVRYDGLRAGFEATQYLVNRGHRKITFLADSRFPWFHEVQQGYLRALRAAGLSPLPFTRKGPEGFPEYGRWAGQLVMKSKRVPTAVLAGNDEIAFGLYQCFRRLNLKVPDDVSVIGFDDREIAAVMEPPLTTVRVPSEEIGRCCVKLLLERLHLGVRNTRTHWVETELVERESVKSLAS